MIPVKKNNKMTSDRIKEIQLSTAYPDSVSVTQALLQVWNECKLEQIKEHFSIIKALETIVNSPIPSDEKQTDTWIKNTINISEIALNNNNQNNTMKYESKYEIGQDVSFFPMYRHIKIMGIENERMEGAIIAIRFTTAKVFYDIADFYHGKIFDNVDSSKVFLPTENPPF